MSNIYYTLHYELCGSPRTLHYSVLLWLIRSSIKIKRKPRHDFCSWLLAPWVPVAFLARWNPRSSGRTCPPSTDDCSAKARESTRKQTHARETCGPQSRLVAAFEVSFLSLLPNCCHYLQEVRAGQDTPDPWSAQSRAFICMLLDDHMIRRWRIDETDWVENWSQVKLIPTQFYLARENSRRLARSPIEPSQNDVWVTSAEIPYW